jgi:hypothetical protein
MLHPKRTSATVPTAVVGVSPNTSRSVSFFPGPGRETRPAATETVALPKIRVGLRPFAVALGLPRNCLTINGIHRFLYSHIENLTIRAKKRKTYGRVLRYDFFWRLRIDANSCPATASKSENPKKAKKGNAKCKIVWAKTRFSCQNELF